MEYPVKGVCSRLVKFDLRDNRVYNVEFLGGCNGNLKGIAKLVEGMEAQDAINRLKGTTCGFKNTSCPDQFARALELALSEK